MKVIEPRRGRGWFISDRAAAGRREVVRQLDPGELGGRDSAPEPEGYE